MLVARNEFERKAIEKFEALRAEGKNPHGFLRDVIIEIELREREYQEEAK